MRRGDFSPTPHSKSLIKIMTQPTSSIILIISSLSCVNNLMSFFISRSTVSPPSSFDVCIIPQKRYFVKGFWKNSYNFFDIFCIKKSLQALKPGGFFAPKNCNKVQQQVQQEKSSLQLEVQQEKSSLHFLAPLVAPKKTPKPL